MLSKISVLTGFVLSAALFARADVTPSEPGPGTVSNAGSTCTVSWAGDKDSTTAWKNMAIELMTGSNLAMVHLTTVATNQDGTVDGRINYICPDVTSYSAIYFYQFTAPGAPDKTWTTRMTIASSSGQTVAPPNATQPNENGSTDAIPWGTGALVDPSTATPAPASAGGSVDAASNSTTSSVASSGAPSSSASSKITTSTLSGKASSTSNGTVAMQTAGSGARGLVGNSMVLGPVLAMASSAIALALSL